ncbi:hypothetical protein M378DRAFT_131303 [Amanita muscaria Koide BX008]|uniref:RBR-type E3 ubiquitin transferase n=1 Tax=Amanita muscaria (strain Koide BX008) TaxID=946122 RepID=A0A0C2SA66_AMAMK|nr:hypothetical protein M378DRAFT_131303 [Amanita muscaria Koide BX008]
MKQREIAEQEACATIRWVVRDGSALVTCGAGLDIRHIVCGFESCFIAIKNLPLHVKKHEVEELFIQQGVDVSRFCVVKMLPTNNEVGAKVICDSELGKTIAEGLDGSEFQDSFLDVTVDNGGIPNKMGSASERSVNFLTITWELSTITMVAQYATHNDAQTAGKKLKRTKFEGRNVQVKLIRSPQLRTSSTSLKISDLPPSVTTTEIERLSGALAVKISPGAATFDKEDVEKFLKRIMTQRKGFESYEASPPNPEKYIAQARVRFSDRESAERAQEYMESQMSEWGYPQLHFSLSKPLQYVITIPLSQYRAQKGRWDSLPVEGDDNKGAFVRVADNAKDKAFIRVLGEDRTAVGQLKVRVENLVAGESLDSQLWHRSFMGPAGQRLLENISARSKAYVRGDWKSKTLKLYADANAKKAAIRLIKAEIKNLEASEWSESINRRAIGFFVRKGLPTLKQELGEDAATLELLPTPRLIISGGEKARSLVARLIAESCKGIESEAMGNGQDTCPICFDEVISPVMLTCGHFYCTSCLQHLLSTAAERKTFPLVCSGTGGKCKVPIAAPIIQRHLQQQFGQLVEAAVTTYIEKRPKKFRYCRTPGCQQVYRYEKGGRVLECPSCFATVCATCHKEGHEGMTCRQRELMDNPGEQERLNEEWARNEGAKRCPSCRVLVQKTEGCNHMECQCGAHFCWLCLRTFPEAKAVYAHLRADHGGINDEATQRERLAQEQADLALAQRLHNEENGHTGNGGQFQARVQQERVARERARDRNAAEEHQRQLQEMDARMRALSREVREMEERRAAEEQKRAARKEKNDCIIM